jgi:SH3-like domain-containing protein
MRRLFAFLIVPALLSAGEGESQLEKLAMESTQFAKEFTGQVKGTKVRMRLQPDLDSSVVRELARNELLMVTGESNDYFSVRPPEGTKLYVYRTLILDGVVEGNHVNLRMAPDLEAPIVAQINAGTRVKTELCDNPKWLSVEPPESVQFFVAKDFVGKIGGPEFIAQREKRFEEVTNLLNSAYMLSQAELRRPVEDIDMEKVRLSFDRVIKDYPDVPECGERAQAVLELVSDVYAQKKAVHLQDVSGIQLVEPREQLERGMHELDQHVAVAAGEQPVEFDAPPRMQLGSKTDKMRLWEPVEETLFHLWSAESGATSMEAFYSEEGLDAQHLTGIIEPYQRPVQNRPGDFVLRVNQRPVAYLYSTEINLDECVGQQVTVQCLERPNNNFAFPAYFVMAVEE